MFLPLALACILVPSTAVEARRSRLRRMLLRHAALLVVAILAMVPAAAGQNLPPRPAAPDDAAKPNEPAGIIRGVVVAADTGTAIRGADIRVDGGTLPRFEPRWARTDAQGRYEITGLGAGRYNLTASKVGYLTLGYGQIRPAEGGRPVDVSESTALEKIDFTLPRGSVIVARVSDQFGDPLRGVSVRAYQFRFVAGERRLQQVSQGSNVTDDRGEQRVFGLTPGEYYVAASPSFTPASPRSDAETFHPGTVRLQEALPVRVGIGQETTVTFAMTSARKARLSGVIVGSTGGPLPNPMASLQMTHLGSGWSRRLALSPDGSFTEENLSPGDYVIEVRSPEWAMQPVRVFGEDVDNLVITTKRAGPVRARVTFEGAQPPADSVVINPAFVGPRCGLMALSGSCGGGSIGLVQPVTGEDWTFNAELTGVGLLRLQRPAGWFLKAVLLDGTDVTDTPLEFSTAYAGKPVDIVLTQRRGELRGAVTDVRGQVTRDCVVVLFPEDEAQWTPFSRFIATARPDQDGRFAVTGLPPGRYLAAALEYLQTGEERNPETLAALRAVATSISLSDGESRTVSLRLAP